MVSSAPLARVNLPPVADVRRDWQRGREREREREREKRKYIIIAIYIVP